MRRTVRQSMIVSVMAITFVYAYSIEKSDIDSNSLIDKIVLSQVKKMLYFAH